MLRGEDRGIGVGGRGRKVAGFGYRGTSLTRKQNPLGPYSRPTPRVLGGSQGVGVFLWARYPCMEESGVLDMGIRVTREPERLVIYCQTTSVSAAYATHCATYYTPCRPLIRAFPGWIPPPPPTQGNHLNDCKAFHLKTTRVTTRIWP